MPLRRFLLANLGGSLLWSLVWGLGSWKLGRQIHSVDDITEKAGLVVVMLTLGVLLVAFGMYMRHRWQRGSQSR
jgi:membrane protein DedA with SNARE-associated domain